MSARPKHYILLHLVVLIWGFTAVLGLLISIPAVEIVLFRTLISSLSLGLLLYFWKKPLRMGRRAAIQIIATGCLIGAHWILFFGAARVATASVCLAGMATSSLWTSFLEPFFYKKKIRLYEVALGVTAILGLYIIFRFEFNHALGLAMAIASAFLASLFTVINSKFTQQYFHYTITFYEMGGAFLFTLLFLPFYAGLMSDGQIYWLPTAMDWVYLLVLALLCTVYAYSASVELMKYVSAYAVNLTTNMEPIYGIMLALLIFGEDEQMTTGFYLGTTIILASVLAYPLIRRYHRRKAARAAEVSR